MTTTVPNPMKPDRKVKELQLRRSPEEAGEDLSTLALSRFAGRAVVLFVFGIDCGTCKHIVATLSRLQEEFAGEAAFVGVCIQTGCRERLTEFRLQTATELSLAYCPTRELYPALGISPSTWLFYPTLIFIDQEQRLCGYFVGGDPFFNNTEANIRSAMIQLLPVESHEPQTLEVNV